MVGFFYLNFNASKRDNNTYYNDIVYILGTNNINSSSKINIYDEKIVKKKPILICLQQNVSPK